MPNLSAEIFLPQQENRSLPKASVCAVADIVFKIEQTATSRLHKNCGMPVESWYLSKALECRRLASEALDARRRAALQEEAARWEEIARDIAARERREASR
jgi:hypothetical protein